MSPPAVLVARLDNCGDVLLAGPTVCAVHEAGRPVVLLCGPKGRPAAEVLPGVDEIVELAAPWIDPDAPNLAPEDAAALADAVRHRGVSDALVLTSSHQSPLPLALLLRWAGVERIAAVSHDHAGALLDARIPGDPDVHEVRRNLLVAAALGFAAPADDRLAVLPSRESSASPPTEPTVVVHPGASVPARTLSPARWSDVVKTLAAGGWRVVVTGTEREARIAAAVSGNYPSVVDLSGGTTFRELGEVIASADAFVGGNTGPLHLAAAVGTPAVAIFPPTVPLARWHPWKVRHAVLGDQAVPCAGCRSRECPLPRQVCLDPVDPAAVADAVGAVARRRPVVVGR